MVCWVDGASGLDLWVAVGALARRKEEVPNQRLQVLTIFPSSPADLHRASEEHQRALGSRRQSAHVMHEEQIHTINCKQERRQNRLQLLPLSVCG